MNTNQPSQIPSEPNDQSNEQRNESESEIQPEKQPSNQTVKKNKGRAGAPNFSKQEITQFLHWTEIHEPLGLNMWSGLAHDYNKWAEQNDYITRDAEALKKKFDRLANVRKKTGRTQPPFGVMEAKRISKILVGNINAKNVGESEEEIDLGTSSNGDETTGTPNGKREANPKQSSYQERKKSKQVEDELLEHVGSMTAHIGDISSTLKNSASGTNQNSFITKDDVVEIVKEEIQSSLATTNESLDELKHIMLQFVSKHRDES